MGVSSVRFIYVNSHSSYWKAPPAESRNGKSRQRVREKWKRPVVDLEVVPQEMRRGFPNLDYRGCLHMVVTEGPLFGAVTSPNGSNPTL
jgi:hypothetical protein